MIRTKRSGRIHFFIIKFWGLRLRSAHSILTRLYSWNVICPPSRPRFRLQICLQCSSICVYRYWMCFNVLQDGANVIHCIEHRDKTAHVRPDIFVYGDCVQCFGKIQVLLLLSYHSIVVSSMKSVRKTLPITLEPELESETNKKDFMRVCFSSTNIFG